MLTTTLKQTFTNDRAAHLDEALLNPRFNKNVHYKQATLNDCVARCINIVFEANIFTSMHDYATTVAKFRGLNPQVIYM